MWHLVQQPIRSLFELRHSQYMPFCRNVAFFYCLHFSVSVCLTVCVCLCLSVCSCLHPCLSLSLSLPISVYVCLCLFLCPCLSFCVYLFVSACLCLCLGHCLCPCLCLCLSLSASLCRDHDLYSCFACDRYERRSRPTGRRQTHTSATEFGIYTQRRVLYAFTFRLEDKKTTIASDLILFRFRVYLGSGMTAVETFRMNPRDLVLKSQNKNAFTTNVRIHVS